LFLNKILTITNIYNGKSRKGHSNKTIYVNETKLYALIIKTYAIRNELLLLFYLMHFIQTTHIVR